MKWITPLHSDPVGWSDSMAKTRLRIVIYTLLQAACVFGGIVLTYERHLTSLGTYLLVYAGITMPMLYLVAMHKLLRLLREAAGAERPSDEGTSL